jgi:3-oxoacyl-[acyl-carrier protein] reductase
MAERGISLVGKTALITGGGSGIGRSIAQTFAEQGAKVVITGRTEPRLHEAAREIVSTGGKCLPVKGDVSKEEDVTRVVAASRKEFGEIDILVNNAGVSKEASFMALSLADWDHQLAVNLKGVIYCIRAVLPGMQDRKAGKIINIASAAGLRGLPGSAAYSAAKAAVIALTQSLGGEIGSSGIRANVICPGPIETEMFLQSGVRDFILKDKTDLMTTDDVAGTALFLASDFSGGINSQVFVIRTKNRW